MRPWLAWLVAFYSLWLGLSFGLGNWAETLAHWPIAVAMALGSFVAGSTPMGGGTVGFPVLVLFFDLPAAMGRDFGLAIQSIGMTSASIFILCRGIPTERGLLLWALPGSALGLVAGLLWIAPAISDASIKLIFACLWASFGCLTLWKNRELCAFVRPPGIDPREARALGLLVGIVGGVTTGLTGVGIDMFAYTLLVLLYRMDLKVSVPTSVLLMASSSIMGSGLQLARGEFGTELFFYWLAASPIVILGAPLGAVFVHVIRRLWTLYFVAVLCLVQFFWTLHQLQPSVSQWIFVAANLSAATVGFALLYRRGRRRAESKAPLAPAVDGPECAAGYQATG